MRVALLLLTLVLAGCSRDTLDRNEWQRMPHADRVLYVKSLLGAEKAKDAKGGTGKTFDRPAEDYVTEIDQAYARGDKREADEIFAELGR
ncbi:MAG TPA: hypothetical protein VGF48_03805 [Thermoanaerobaculia bacterium]|jgi:predicted Fe-S protein YdhL (DUF1289 family)